MMIAKSFCKENQQKYCKCDSKHFKLVLLRMENYNGDLSNFQNTTFHKGIMLLSDEETINAHILFQELSLNFIFQKISTEIRKSHSSMQAG